MRVYDHKITAAMSHVFVSYKREDQPRTHLVVQALEKAGLSPWWDQMIPGGEQWRQRVAMQLKTAKCVVVLWTEASIGHGAEFVLEEANYARQHGTLLPVRLDGVAPPFGFGERQSIDLTGWQGDPDDPRFLHLVSTARAMLDGQPVPVPPAPRKRFTWTTTLWKAAILPVIVVLGMIADTLAGGQIVCEWPGVSLICGRLGFGNAPSPEESQLWASRTPGDCTVSREYISRYPNGKHAVEASTRLTGKTIVSQESWNPGDRRLALVVRGAVQPWPTLDAARADVLRQMNEEALRTCRAAYQQAEFRFRSADVVKPEPDCMKRMGGFACQFDGEAVCHVEARRVDQAERCP